MVIKTEQLQSTAILSATYDDETEDLDVTFVNGGTYTHHGVPVEIFDGLVASSSPGRYWHANLKDQY